MAAFPDGNHQFVIISVSTLKSVKRCASSRGHPPRAKTTSSLRSLSFCANESVFTVSTSSTTRGYCCMNASRRARGPKRSSRAVKEYLATLDDTAWGSASDVVPKFVSPSDPAAQWTGAHKGPAFFAYSDNYLIDVKFGVIVDVEASRAIRQAEVGAAKTMIERTEERFGLKPERLVGDTAYGAAPMLNWLVEERGIAPHIPVFDKSKRDDGTFSRGDFRYDCQSAPNRGSDSDLMMFSAELAILQRGNQDHA